MNAIGRVSTVMVNCSDSEALATFWTAVLGVEVTERAGPFTWLAPQEGSGVGLAFQQVADPRPGGSGLHLDVAVADLEAARALVEELGGRHVVRRTGSITWDVMADPEGNEFCLYVPHP